MIERAFIPILAVVMTLSAMAIAAQPDDAAAVFEPVEALSPLSQQPWIVDQQAVLPRWRVLDAAQAGSELLLNLNRGTWLVGVVDEVWNRGPERYTISGHLADVDHASFIIVRHGDALAADVRAPLLKLFVDTRYIADGVHIIRQIDEDALPPVREVYPMRDPPVSERALRDAEIYGHSERERGFPEPTGREDCWPQQPVFDLLIVYTNVARQAAGGTNAIVARCHLAVERTNQAYENSLIDARMRLVFCDEETYDESGTFQDHIDRLTVDDDGELDIVHGLRNAYHADFVSLFVDDDDQDGSWHTYGVAWCETDVTRAFSVVNWEQSSSGYVLAHETGHNLNCDHDRANEFGSPCNDDGHSFGHRFVGDSDEEFRTIMSYQPGTRIPHFSNPSVSYDGQPTGVPLSSQDPCHNSLSITDRRDTVEEYRLTRFDIWVDFDVGVYQEGTYHYPYATLAAAVTEIDAGINATESPTMWIKTGTTDETVTINERMIIRACDDSVVIGAQP